MTAGIRTLADLRDRCYVDDATGCWHWRGFLDEHGTPRMRIGESRSYLRAPAAMRALIAPDVKRNRLRTVWSPSCLNRDCMSPEHRKPVSKSVHMLRFIGGPRDPIITARAINGRRRSRIYTDEQIEAVRAAEGTNTAIAERFGMSRQHVAKVRLCEVRRPAISPFDALLRFSAVARAVHD